MAAALLAQTGAQVSGVRARAGHSWDATAAAHLSRDETLGAGGSGAAGVTKVRSSSTDPRFMTQ
jgi:hypothetical protein